MRTEYETHAVAHILVDGEYSTKTLVSYSHTNAQKHHKLACKTALLALEWPETQSIEVTTCQSSRNLEHNYNPYALERTSARNVGDDRWTHTDF